ncbi:hypothetical protein Q8F55_001688 [Vanrija albida]|uniref:Elongin-A n=1 Tax=Vanrija albida TaxID=181172 RepID=A0ABR3Q8I9_9TREE
MPDAHALEYEESDGEESGDGLFGSDDEELPPAFTQANIDTRRPVAQGGKRSQPPSPTKAAAPPIARTPITATPAPVRVTSDQRLAELRGMRHYPAPSNDGPGPDSLRNYASRVVRANAGRIWDIGGLNYSVVADLIDNLPRQQLSEIEEASPHILKDTDWLWEAFIITEYPVFYQECKMRKGEPRTTGWRRMYAKAVADAERRKQQAAERIKERYAQMEAERASKKIVVLNTFVAPKKGKSLAQTRRGASAAQPTPPPPNRAQSAIAKARNEAARARVALTHASGKYIPPPVAAPRRPNTAPGEGELYKNPYLSSNAASGSSSAAPPKPVLGPRLPAPRIPRPKVFPDAYKTAEEAARRAALPANIAPRPASPPRERFRIDDKPRTSVPIPKPKVDNFKASKPLPFFSSPVPVGVAPKRPADSVGSPRGDKRPRVDGGSAPTSEAGSRPPSRPSTPTPASVLFMKKKPRPKPSTHLQPSAK